MVTNGKPGCQLKLSVHGRDAYGKIGADGTATVPLLVGPISGVYVIHARTYACKAVENATIQVVVTKYKLLGPKQVKAGEKFAVQATGWLPNLPITFTISDGHRTLTFPSETGKDGRVTQGVSVPYPGTWAVVVTQQGGPTKSYALQVTKASKHGDRDGDHKKPASHPAPKPKPKSTPEHKPTPKPTHKPTPKPTPKPTHH